MERTNIMKFVVKLEWQGLARERYFQKYKDIKNRLDRHQFTRILRHSILQKPQKMAEKLITNNQKMTAKLSFQKKSLCLHGSSSTSWRYLTLTQTIIKRRQFFSFFIWIYLAYLFEKLVDLWCDSSQLTSIYLFYLFFFYFLLLFNYNFMKL